MSANAPFTNPVLASGPFKPPAATNCLSTPTFKLKSVTVWLPYCGCNCGNYPVPAAYLGDLSGGFTPAFTDSGCDGDQEHYCGCVHFLDAAIGSCSNEATALVMFDQGSCQVTATFTSNPAGACTPLTPCGSGGIYPGYLASPESLSNPSTVPAIAQVLLATVNISELAWGQHVQIYPVLDPVASAAGKCLQEGRSLDLDTPNTCGAAGPCFQKNSDGTTQTTSTTYTYSASTVPAWLNGGGGDITAINAPSEPSVLVGFTGHSPGCGWGNGAIGNIFEYANAPGFPDPTYGDPCGGWWVAQIIMLEIDGAPFCICSGVSGSEASNCTGAIPATVPLKRPPDPGPVTVTLHPTWMGAQTAYFPLTACNPCWVCSDVLGPPTYGAAWPPPCGTELPGCQCCP